MAASQDHPVFQAPSEREATIWRYMDFTKYVAMLHARALYFARADLLGDAFEGSVPKANIDLRSQIYRDDPIPLEIWKQFSSFQERSRFWTFINCWHVSEYESAAMWRLYSATNQTIAIKSTYALLCDVLPESSYVGMVKYIDYAKEWMPEGNSFWPYVHKRRSFGHEQEIRAVIQELPTKSGGGLDLSQPPIDQGRLIPVALETLIKGVVVAPTAPNWFRQLTDATTERFGLKVEVQQSQLDETPVF